MPIDNPSFTSNIIRKSHYRSLDYMDSVEFIGVKELFESIPEIGGVYFRPTSKGPMPVDLSETSLKPRVGIGDEIRIGTKADSLSMTMPDRLNALRIKRSRQKSASRESQFEAYLIREAQANRLILPDFPSQIRFIHSQWRLDNKKPLVTDIIGVDLVSRALVIIELKKSNELSALSQAEEYADYFRRHGAEISPFFSRIAHVMGKLYNCPELINFRVAPQAVHVLTAWPSENGSIHVNGCEVFDSES